MYCVVTAELNAHLRQVEREEAQLRELERDARDFFEDIYDGRVEDLHPPEGYLDMDSFLCEMVADIDGWYEARGVDPNVDLEDGWWVSEFSKHPELIADIEDKVIEEYMRCYE